MRPKARPRAPYGLRLSLVVPPSPVERSAQIRAVVSDGVGFAGLNPCVQRAARVPVSRKRGSPWPTVGRSTLFETVDS